MKAPDLHYVRPRTLDEALALLAEHGDEAAILAGGQSLMPLLNLRLAAPRLLVDINRLPDLSEIRDRDDCIEIGALVRHTELGRASLVARHTPLLHQAVPDIAHPAIRNRGTLGGSLALADPAAELPACCLALGATMFLARAGGTRSVPADDFFLGLYETTRRPDEMLTAIRLPKAGPGSVCRFVEIARRRGDFALAGIALSGRRDGDRLCDLRIALCGVADRPVLAGTTMQVLEGHAPTMALIDRACAALTAELDPPDDALHPAAYRRHLAAVLLGRVLTNLSGDATC